MQYLGKKSMYTIYVMIYLVLFSQCRFIRKKIVGSN